MSSEVQAMTLAELAEQSGLPGRTIRFYIARGLLPGPKKAGRGARYEGAHLERLRHIAEWQGRGLSLVEIAHRLAGPGSPPPALVPTPWWQYPVAEDVVVSVRGDVAPWRLKQIKTQIRQMMSGLSRTEKEESL
jgi:DNA-binding transcriptional MerR regulator